LVVFVTFVARPGTLFTRSWEKLSTLLTMLLAAATGPDGKEVVGALFPVPAGL
jgi:hypothetical protein